MHPPLASTPWPIRFARLVLSGLPLLLPASALAGDDDPPPPYDPGPGFEGLFPAPTFPPGYIPDQQTTPYGVRQVFNTPQVHLGQGFTPTTTRLDWAAFVFQNHTQPNTTAGPGTLRVSLYQGLTTTSGALTGLLAHSAEATIPADTTAWLVFHFPQTVTVVPGTRYFLRVEQVSGYPSWVGGRIQNFYFGGGAFGYFAGSNLFWNNYDFNFATGAICDAVGDVNCDCQVNFDDIDGFVIGLISPTALADAHPRCAPEAADTNGDGAVNFDDIDPFIVCVINGACP